MYTLSLLIFTNTETDSLEYTIKQFISLVDVPYRVTVLLKTAHCPSAAVMQRLMAEHPHWKISTAVQKTQDKFQYFQELSTLASGTHFMVWPSDNEVDIAHVKDLLAVSKASPDAIVSLSKFHKDSVLDGYGAGRTLARKAINRLICMLYRREGNDFFSTFEIFPRRYISEFRYTQTREFVFEYNLIPLRLGVEYIELPMHYHKRKSGKSNFSLLFYCHFAFLYVLNIFKIFLTPKSKLLQKSSDT